MPPLPPSAEKEIVGSDSCDRTLVAQAQIAKMRARLAELEATYFNPKRGHDDGTAQRVAREKWGSYWGPFIFP